MSIQNSSLSCGPLVFLSGCYTMLFLECYKNALMEHSQLACPGAAIANFRFGIFALEPPKDL